MSDNCHCQRSQTVSGPWFFLRRWWGEFPGKSRNPGWNKKKLGCGPPSQWGHWRHCYWKGGGLTSKMSPGKKGVKFFPGRFLLGDSWDDQKDPPSWDGELSIFGTSRHHVEKTYKRYNVKAPIFCDGTKRHVFILFHIYPFSHNHCSVMFSGKWDVSNISFLSFQVLFPLPWFMIMGERVRSKRIHVLLAGPLQKIIWRYLTPLRLSWGFKLDTAGLPGFANNSFCLRGKSGIFWDPEPKRAWPLTGKWCQVCGWAGTTSVCTLFAQVMVRGLRFTVSAWCCACLKVNVKDLVPEKCTMKKMVLPED